MGVMVALLPAASEEPNLQVDGADVFQQQHVTLVYYGDTVDDDMHSALIAAAQRAAAASEPFDAHVIERGPLGDESPPADVLIFAGDPLFQRARMEFPPPDGDVEVFPDFIPHLTVGYGITDDALLSAAPSDTVHLDTIAVVNGDDWQRFELGATTPVTAATFTAEERRSLAKKHHALPDGSFPIRPADAGGKSDLQNALQSIGRAKNRTRAEQHIRRRARAIGQTKMLPDWMGAKTAAIPGFTPGIGWASPAAVAAYYLDGTTPVTAAGGLATTAIGDVKDIPSHATHGHGKGSPHATPFHGKNQICFHGSKATCHSVKWIAVYTALREKRGMTKEEAARISNSMDNHWRHGTPRRGDKRPLIRKTI